MTPDTKVQANAAEIAQTVRRITVIAMGDGITGMAIHTAVNSAAMVTVSAVLTDSDSPWRASAACLR